MSENPANSTSKKSNICRYLMNLSNQYPLVQNSQIFYNLLLKYCPETGKPQYNVNVDNIKNQGEYIISMNERKNKPDCTYYKTLYNILERNKHNPNILDYYDFMQMVQLKSEAKYYIQKNCNNYPINE